MQYFHLLSQRLDQGLIVKLLIEAIGTWCENEALHVSCRYSMIDVEVE